MVISRNVVYRNLENTLNTDVIEIDINTKNTKIFMYNDNEKVNIREKLMVLSKNLELNLLKKKNSIIELIKYLYHLVID